MSPGESVEFPSDRESKELRKPDRPLSRACLVMVLISYCLCSLPSCCTGHVDMGLVVELWNMCNGNARILRFVCTGVGIGF